MLDKLKSKYAVSEHKITVDKQRDIQIAAKVFSNGKAVGVPTLLFPGGPGAGGSIYYDHIPFLIKFGPIILIDPRGTGESDKLYPEFWDLQHHIDDVEAVRRALNLNKFNFLGRSYGGVVAQGYALKYQKYLEKLILIVTNSDFHFLEIAERKALALADPTLREAAMHILNGTIKDKQHMHEVFATTAPLYSMKLKNNPKPQKKLAKNPHKDFSHENLNIGFSSYLRSFEFTSQLQSIKVPTLVVGAKNDWICDSSCSYKIAMNIENSRLILLPGGHSLFYDCKKQYIWAIESFLKNKL